MGGREVSPRAGVPRWGHRVEEGQGNWRCWKTRVSNPYWLSLCPSSHHFLLDSWVCTSYLLAPYTLLLWPSLWYLFWQAIYGTQLSISGPGFTLLTGLSTACSTGAHLCPSSDPRPGILVQVALSMVSYVGSKPYFYLSSFPLKFFIIVYFNFKIILANCGQYEK